MYRDMGMRRYTIITHIKLPVGYIPYVIYIYYIISSYGLFLYIVYINTLTPYPPFKFDDCNFLELSSFVYNYVIEESKRALNAVNYTSSDCDSRLIDSLQI